MYLQSPIASSLPQRQDAIARCLPKRVYCLVTCLLRALRMLTWAHLHQIALDENSRRLQLASDMSAWGPSLATNAP